MSEEKFEKPVRTTVASFKGHTLAYRGAKFASSSFSKDGHYIDTSEKESSPLEVLTERFSNLGALVIRFHLGQGQRAGLLQQVAKSTYAANPVEKPAKGADDIALFFDSDHTDPAKAIAETYEFASHMPLGRSKLLNERAQPLVHVNKAGHCGEQGIWEIIHAPVWGVGRNLQFELSKQGFRYVACPHDLSTEGRAIVHHQLEANTAPWSAILEKNSIVPKIAKMQDLDIHLDDKALFTKESNGLAIKITEPESSSEFSPLGWIIHEQSGHVLPQNITEDIIRVIAISKGGFYERTPMQQKILQGAALRPPTSAT